jgi:hypothetical protein
MPFREWIPRIISGFRGAWSSLSQTEARTERAFFAENVAYQQSKLTTRDGTTVLRAVTGKVTSMFNWLAAGANYLIFVEGTKARLWNFAQPVVDLFDLINGGRSISVADMATNIYIATRGTTGLGTQQARIAYPLVGGAPSDKAFGPPWQQVPTMVDFGAGNCTEGEHKFGYIAQTRSGFAGRPGPVNAGTIFQPITFNVPAGGREIRMAFSNITTPADAQALLPIMTRKDNPNTWYFVPDAGYPVPPGNPNWSFSIPINISDEDLAARAEEASDYFLCLSQDASGNGPFWPSKLLAYGNRLCWFNDNKLYVSDPYDFQFLTEDRNAIQTPNQRRMITGFVLRKLLYVLGDRWTYVWSDNDDYPRAWGSPEPVSGSLGTTAVDGVCAETLGDYAWVANESGLYQFTGMYPALPISYRQSDDWARINWATAAHTVQVIEDAINRCVIVLAPLDGATEPTHLLVWDFSNGYGPDEADYARYKFAQGAISSVAIVRDGTSNQTALCIGPAAAGNILRKTPGARDDAGQPITMEYETGFILEHGLKERLLSRFGGIAIDVRGIGTVNITPYHKDRKRHVADVPPIVLSDYAEGPGSTGPLWGQTLGGQSLTGNLEAQQAKTAEFAIPGKEIERKWMLKSENATIKLSCSGWIEVHSIKAFWRSWLSNR